jgi:hypothetical protein
MEEKKRVRGYRVRQRALGLRLIQLWVPDTRSRIFAAECRRQSRLLQLQGDIAETEALKFIEDAGVCGNDAAR